MMTSNPKPCFFIDAAFTIEGTGTIVTGEVLDYIEVDRDIWIVSEDAVEGQCKIKMIELIQENERKEIQQASAGQLVGILIDFPKEKIEKGMCIFLRNDNALPAVEEIIETLKKINQKLFNEKKEILTKTLERYIEPLKAKENQLVYIDDYGDYNFDRWFEECDSFINNKLFFLKKELIEKSYLILKQFYQNKLSEEMYSTCEGVIESEIHSHLVEEINSRINSSQK